MTTLGDTPLPCVAPGQPLGGLSAGCGKTVFGPCHHQGVSTLAEGGNHGGEEFALGGRGVDAVFHNFKRPILLL